MGIPPAKQQHTLSHGRGCGRAAPVFAWVAYGAPEARRRDAGATPAASHPAGGYFRP